MKNPQITQMNADFFKRFVSSELDRGFLEALGMRFEFKRNILNLRESVQSADKSFSGEQQ